MYNQYTHFDAVEAHSCANTDSTISLNEQYTNADK